MGTHISKVKSLTMDSWTSEQVEVSNNLVNKRNTGRTLIWPRTEHEEKGKHNRQQRVQPTQRQT
jgi:hypothetical protein